MNGAKHPGSETSRGETLKGQIVHGRNGQSTRRSRVGGQNKHCLLSG